MGAGQYLSITGLTCGVDDHGDHNPNREISSYHAIVVGLGVYGTTSRPMDFRSVKLMRTCHYTRAEKRPCQQSCRNKKYDQAISDDQIITIIRQNPKHRPSMIGFRAYDRSPMRPEPASLAGSTRSSTCAGCRTYSKSMDEECLPLVQPGGWSVYFCHPSPTGESACAPASCEARTAIV